MKRSLLQAFALALAPAAPAALPAQEIPGIRAALLAPSIVTATGEVAMRFTIVVDHDTTVPSTLLNGHDLTVRVGGEELPPLQKPGVGEPVRLLAGTRIDRMLTLPVATLLPQRGGDGDLVLIAVGWRDMAGADCSFKVAPDPHSIRLEDLDLERTEVVLVTNYGDMRVAFRPDKAPNTCANFVKLCLSGFYDGTLFHRIERDFVIQGGCPYTKDQDKRELWGSGGPGYTIQLEPSDLRHLKGTLSMARTSDPNSAGSGFFVVHRDSPHLDRQYAAFANVVEGIDTLERIANVPVGGPRSTAPLQPVVLQAAIVLPKKKRK